MVKLIDNNKAIQTSMTSIHAGSNAEPHAPNGGGAFQTAST